MSKRLETRYKDYLIELVEGGKYPIRRDFMDVIDEMWETEFVYTLDMDENRAKDGLYLRYLFDYQHKIKKENGVEVALRGQPCTYLEMAISLSKRLYETFLAGNGDENMGPCTVFCDILDEISAKNLKSCQKYIKKGKIGKSPETLEIWWFAIRQLEKKYDL